MNSLLSENNIYVLQIVKSLGYDRILLKNKVFQRMCVKMLLKRNKRLFNWFVVQQNKIAVTIKKIVSTVKSNISAKMFRAF